MTLIRDYRKESDWVSTILLAVIFFAMASPVIGQDHFDPGTLDRLHWPLLKNWPILKNRPLLQNGSSVEKNFAVLGSQSCASASCHGGPRPGVVSPRVKRGNAYPLWIENDPHAQSWRTFCSDESVAMMRRLKILDSNGDVVDQVGYDNCLACHNSTPRYSQNADVSTSSHSLSSIESFDGLHLVGLPSHSDFQREGVGCSACHGPSERWIGTHYQDGWNGETATVDGFINADDLLTRARMCASCHVGDQDRDMNHDIIAAGHPALRYEFTTFHQRQPKHWRDEESGAAWRYEAQLWLAGQIAAMDASLSLINSRASNGNPSYHGMTGIQSVSQWPELSAYDCAACHHTLGFANERRPDQPFSRKAAGMASSWNDIGMRWLLEQRIRTGQAVDLDFQLLDAIEGLRKNMESNAVPNADTVSASASQVRRLLADWVDQVYCVQRFEFEADDLAELVVFASGDTETYRTWESTAQYYLAAAAARNAWPQGASGPAFLVANQLRVGLRYADQTKTPRFAKRNSLTEGTLGNGDSTLSRSEAATLSVELAAWLGGAQRPDLSSFESDARDTESLQRELQAVIDRVNETLKKQRDERAQSKPDQSSNRPGQPSGLPESGLPDSKTKRPDVPLPKPRVKSPQELLEELRKKRTQDANPFGDD